MKLLIILYLFSSVGCFHVDAGPELATTDAAVPVDHDLQDVGWDEAKTSLVLANNVINDADSSTLKRSRRRRKKKMNSWPLKSAAAASDNLEKKQQLEHLFSQASSSSMNADGRQALHRHAKLSTGVLSDLMFDVVKEIVAELITETLGSYLGFSSSRRTDTGDTPSADGIGGFINNLMDMILDAVRKHTLRKERGCL